MSGRTFSSSEYFRRVIGPPTKEALTALAETKESSFARALANYLPIIGKPVAPVTLERWNQLVAHGKANGVFTITLMIGPDVARHLLDYCNPDNRKISDKWAVPRAMKSLVNGTFEHNGETIKIATTAAVNDGQNRLTACAETGIPFITEVTFGLARDSRKSVDIGITKVIHHLLQMRGCANVKDTALGAALVLSYERVKRFNTHSPEDRGSPEEMDAWVAAHPEFADSVNAASRLYKHVKVSKGVYAALHYILSQSDKTATATFFTRLETGIWEGQHKRDPVHRLREYIHHNSPFKGRDGHEILAAVTIKSFNAMKAKKPITQLYFRSGGDEPEKFPVIE